MSKISVLCFMKPHERIRNFLYKNFDADIIDNSSSYNIELTETSSKTYDYVISYLSPWILPKWVLAKARIDAINFHPAPPKYPGSAGYNLAIYNKDKAYGCTCHKMVEKVDSGDIYERKVFPLLGNETVSELKEKTHVYLETLFYEIMNYILKEVGLYSRKIVWACEPHKFEELRELCDCTGITDQDELALRIRACTYPGAKDYPYVKINDKKVRLEYERSNNGQFNVSNGTSGTWSTAPVWLSEEFDPSEC